MAAMRGFSRQSNNARQFFLIAAGVAAILAVGAGSALATPPPTDTYWNVGVGTGNWADAANWTDGVPDSTVAARMLNTASSTITVPTGAAAMHLIMGDAVTLSGGTLALGAVGNDYALMIGAGGTIASDLLSGSTSASDLSLIAEGVTTLTGNNTAFAGHLHMQSNGRLTIGSDTAVPGTFVNNFSSVLGLANGITTVGTPLMNLLNNGDTAIAPNLSGDSNVNTWSGDVSMANGDADKHINVDGGGVLNIQGTINKYGAGVIHKIGDGTLALNGAVNLNTAATHVAAGTLLINGAAAGSTGVTVDAGATLGGKGSIDGTVSVSGKIAAGVDGAVSVFQTGSQAWLDGSNVQVGLGDIFGTPGAGIGWDVLAINGTLDLSSLSSTTGITVSTAGRPGLDFGAVLSKNWSVDFADTTDGIVGFAADKFNLTDLNSALANVGKYAFVSQSGNNLLLNVANVPEPGTLALLVAAGMGLAIWARKRK
jgi:fibronectin-binding autotransporter adhesin